MILKPSHCELQKHHTKVSRAGRGFQNLHSEDPGNPTLRFQSLQMILKPSHCGFEKHHNGSSRAVTVRILELTEADQGFQFCHTADSGIVLGLAKDSGFITVKIQYPQAEDSGTDRRFQI